MLKQILTIVKPTALVSSLCLGLLSSSFIFTPTPARADLFCLPWENDCVQDGRTGGDPLGTDYNQKTFNVYLVNKSDRPLWIAAHYKVYNSSSWVTTTGYWYIQPGAEILTDISTDNAIVYFHAHDANGNYWGADQYYWDINGKNQPFFEVNMGNQIGTYRQGFN